MPLHQLPVQENETNKKRKMEKKKVPEFTELKEFKIVERVNGRPRLFKGVLFMFNFDSFCIGPGTCTGTA